MKFKDWLLANWDDLRKNTESLSGDDCKTLDLENSLRWIHNSHERPLDSWDRLFALYLIDVHPECVDKTWGEVKDIEDVKDFGFEGFEGYRAYSNYEREWLDDEDAWREMANVAKRGREAVLADSYETGGWFGVA